MREPDQLLVVALAVLVITAGSVFTFFSVQQEDARMRAELLTRARIAVQAIDPADVAALFGSSADLALPEYGFLKDQMIRTRAADPGIRFTYLMGQREGGEIVFLVDSEPPESADYSPPGQVYGEASEFIRESFRRKAELTGGPSADRWGTWVSSFVPVTGRETGRLIAVFGMDVDATSWNRSLSASALPGILGTLLILAILASFSVVYRRSRQEKLLVEQSEEAYRTVFEHTGSATIQVDEDSVISMVNGRFETLTGYTRAEIEGRRKWTEFVHPDDLQMMAEYHKRRRESGASPPMQYEFRLITKDGSKKDILLSAGLIPGTKKTVASLFDLTEKKDLERTIRKSEEQYQQLYDLANDGIIVVREGIIQRCNAGFAAITRYPIAELVGMPIADFIHPEDKKTVIDRHMRRLNGEAGLPAVYTFRLVWKDGTVRWVELNTRLIEWDGKPATLNIVRDITERKKIEEALVLTNQKLNLLSSITRHDVLNQLMILRGYLQLSQQHLGNREMSELFISREMNSVNTIEHQILFTRDYQDMGIKAPAWQDLGMTIIRAKGALPMRDVAVATQHTNVEVFADPLFEKVFFNLVDNALRHAGDALTTIRVSTHETGTGLTIVFEDDGIGIPDGIRRDLFTRGAGKNTGFGLFLSREILSITGITIAETVTFGRGARFEIAVPPGAYRYTGHRQPGGKEPEEPGGGR